MVVVERVVVVVVVIVVGYRSMNRSSGSGVVGDSSSSRCEIDYYW